MPAVPNEWFALAEAERVGRSLEPEDAAYLAQQLRAHGYARLATTLEVGLLQHAGYDIAGRGPGSIAHAIAGDPPTGPLRAWLRRVGEHLSVAEPEPPEIH